MEEEIWKYIEGYEGAYQVSNLGRVRSLERIVPLRDGLYRVNNERILKLSPDSHGYLTCCLYKDGTKTTKKIHVLVAIAFLGHVPNRYTLVVDHINGDKLDNRAVSLQIVTHSQNLQTCHRKNKVGFSSQYVGVSWDKQRKKWEAQITINGKTKHLGRFDSEIDSSNSYQNALKKISLVSN